jgi:hypothetical protein
MKEITKKMIAIKETSHVERLRASNCNNNQIVVLGSVSASTLGTPAINVEGNLKHGWY